MKPKSARSVSHSISCTPLEWERIRERAHGEGKPISRYLVQRALTMEPGEPAPGSPPRMVLTEEEQQEMFLAVSTIAALLSEEMFQEDASSPNLPGRVRILFETKLDEMTRTGRYGQMKTLLAQVFEDEKASMIGAAAYERNRTPGR